MKLVRSGMLDLFTGGYGRNNFVLATRAILIREWENAIKLEK